MPQHKLRLQMDDLRVETFATARNGTERGTVRAHGEYDTATFYEYNAERWGCACNTMEQTCNGSCAPSCAYSCPGRPGCDGNETNYLTCGETCMWVGGQAMAC